MPHGQNEPAPLCSLSRPASCPLHPRLHARAPSAGYMAVFCLGLGLLCGTLGYIGCSMFVRRIYCNIKID